MKIIIISFGFICLISGAYWVYRGIKHRRSIKKGLARWNTKRGSLEFPDVGADKTSTGYWGKNSGGIGVEIDLKIGGDLNND